LVIPTKILGRLNGPPFPELFEELTVGETWNTLARLRRHLEIELREFGMKRGFKEKYLRSAGQITQILGRIEGIDLNALDRLRYAISVCNRAVHGRQVSDSEAAEAVWNGAIGLKDLLRPADQRPT